MSNPSIVATSINKTMYYCYVLLHLPCCSLRSAVIDGAAGKILDHSQFVHPAIIHMSTSTQKPHCQKEQQAH